MRIKTPHTATRWPKIGVDEFGQPMFDNPQVIPVRWEDRTQLFQDAEGREKVSVAQIFPEIDMSVGDYIARGDHSSISDPRVSQVGHQISRIEKIDSVDGRRTVRQVLI